MKNLKLKVLTLISIIGAIYVSFGYSLTANFLWSFSNPLLSYHNFKENQKEQGFLFLIFGIIALWGVVYFYINLLF